VIAIALGLGVVYVVARRLCANLSPPAVLSRAVVVLTAVALIAIVLVMDPAQRFAEFKKPPVVDAAQSIQSHLVSGSGSGRWQFWTAALHEWESAPIIGRGAGSFEAWWAQHASFVYFVRNAHSLYLEVLAELGVIGLLLLCGALGVGGVLAVRNTLLRAGQERLLTAALLGVLAAFYFGAAIEWIWQLTAVSAVGIACLGLLVGPAGQAADLSIATRREPPSRQISLFATAIAFLIVGWLLICAQALPWLTDQQIKTSAMDVARNDAAGALRHALDAKDLQPWAASPYLQLALVTEQSGDLVDARKWMNEAIERDSTDWRLWLVSARINTKSGRIAAAQYSLRRARALNPRSPLLRNLDF
jgi:O-Antigen ligase